MSSEKTVFTCWTKFKGGKFKLDDGVTWKEYNKNNEVINTYEQLDRYYMISIFILLCYYIIFLLQFIV